MTTWDDLLRPGDAADFFARATMPPFDPTAVAFHPANALWLAELSRVVYRRDAGEGDPVPQPTRTSFLAAAGLRSRRFFHSLETHSQALLVESVASPRFAVLAFRGTEQHPRDFITDVDLGAKPLASDAIVAHAGFDAALDSIWPAIEEELAQVTAPLYFTGHSLGAALATLAAARRAPWAVYTFGSPLVGNAAFVAALERVPIYRVVNDSDPVTEVPPSLFGYRHAGELVVVKESRVAAVVTAPAAWVQHLSGVPKPLADHAPVNYVDRIAALAGESGPLSSPLA